MIEMSVAIENQPNKATETAAKPTPKKFFRFSSTRPPNKDKIATKRVIIPKTIFFPPLQYKHELVYVDLKQFIQPLITTILSFNKFIIYFTFYFHFCRVNVLNICNEIEASLKKQVFP